MEAVFWLQADASFPQPDRKDKVLLTPVVTNFLGAYAVYTQIMLYLATERIHLRKSIIIQSYNYHFIIVHYPHSPDLPQHLSRHADSSNKFPPLSNKKHHL